MKIGKKKITVYLTAENEALLDEYRQNRGKIHYSRAVNEILGLFLGEGEVDEEDEEVEWEVRLRGMEERWQEVEVLREEVRELREQCDRLLSVHTHQKQALLQAQQRERQFCQKLSETIHTVQTRTSPAIDREKKVQEQPQEFDILDAELVDTSAEELLWKLSQELGLL